MTKIDWMRAELLYQQGEISVREIARREGVSEGAVRKRAKAHGWKRETPVRSLVRTRAQASLTRASAEHGFLSAEDESEAPEWYHWFSRAESA